MANKRFNQITRVVTSFDSNDILPIGNGALGDGKMSKDMLLELTAQNARSIFLPRTDSFVGIGGSASMINGPSFNVDAGNVYAIKPSLTDWAVSTIADGSYKLRIQYQDSSGTWVYLLNYAKADVVPDVIYVTATAEMKKMRILFRGDVGASVLFDIYVDGVISKKDASERCQLYITNGGIIYLEESHETSGKVWIKAAGNENARWASRLGVNYTKTNAEFAATLGVSLENSKSGIAGCIPIAHQYCLTLNKTDGYLIKSRNSVKDDDVIVLSVSDGIVIGAALDICLLLLRDPSVYYPTNEASIKTKILDVLNTGISDKFIFATDIHVLYAGDWKFRLKNVINRVAFFYKNFPFDFVSFGGDWLKNSLTQVEAIEQLGKMTSLCNDTFKKFLPTLGNHDTNYQGVVSSDDPSRGDLSQQVLNSVMFCYNGGKSYYRYKGNYTEFFVFDTGLDWTASTTSEYQKEQLKWFGNILENERLDNIAIIQHIVTNDVIANVGNNFNLVSFASDIVAMCNAYNSRTAITKYGVEYDFTNVLGKIRFIIAGHSHADAVQYFSGLPVVITTRFAGNTFDLAFVDYNTNKLKLVRVGTGSDRTLDLFN